LDVPCTHYSFEATSGQRDERERQLGECFVFGSCEDPQEATSTVYELDDWCHKSQAEGGCPETHCDNDDEGVFKEVCGFPKMPDCSIDACVDHCVKSTGLDAPCTHYVYFVHDHRPKNYGACYLHVGCDHKEKPTDLYQATHTVYRLTEAEGYAGPPEPEVTTSAAPPADDDDEPPAAAEIPLAENVSGSDVPGLAAALLLVAAAVQ
jgi:hypothetical protein